MARRTTATAAADRRASDRDLMRYWPEVFGSGSFGPFPPEFAPPRWLPEFPGSGGRPTGWFLNAGTAVAMRATEAAPTRAFATTPLEKTDFKAGHGRPRPAIRRASRRQLCRWAARLRRPRINRRSTTLFETPRSSATSL